MFPSPYIDGPGLIAAPLPVTWKALGQTNATPDQVLDELALICEIATTNVNGEVGQQLRATVDIEANQAPSHRCGILNNGMARFMTSMAPVLKVVQVQVAYGGPVIAAGGATAAFQYTTLPSGIAFPEQQPFGVYGSSAPGGATAGQNAILIAGGYVNWWAGRMGTRVLVTYVNGWPHTALTAPAVQGATSIEVDDVTGWYNSALTEGALGWIYDPTPPGGGNETIQCTGVTATGAVNGEPAGPGTLTLASGMAYAHTAGPLVSAMPTSIRDAAGLFAAAEGLRKGMAAITAPNIPGSGGGSGSVQSAIEYLEKLAAIELNTFRRIIGT